MDELKFAWHQWWPWHPWRIVGNVQAADEVPLRLPRKGMVMVGQPQHPKWLAFDCPCHLHHRIVVSLDARNRPYWRVTADKRVSLWPSIDSMTDGKRCHFVIRNGTTTWVKDKERTNE